MSLTPRARVHLSNIAYNWRMLNAAQDGGVTGAVVKADAYGHGLKQVAQTLHDAGCDHFFVAHCFEGEAARRALGPNPVIYVLNGPSPYEEPAYRQYALTPVINSDQQFHALLTWIQTGGKLAKGYALKFDTGMNRLGIPARDAPKLADAVKGMEPNLILSHLACAEDRENAMNAFQATRFETICDLFPNIPVSLASSGGTYLGKPYTGALTRPGIALYGGGFPPKDMSLKPGLTLEAPILQIRTVEEGESVGYSATYRATEPRLLATIAIGYGDGFLRSASNKGFASIEGHRCPIVGRVSMDLITIDVTSVPALARPGVFAQLIGPDAPLEEQAALAGTIGYELTTGLLPRVTRIYED